jgi:ATP-dependent RNA helicase SUPV3L1/SUV3
VAANVDRLDQAEGDLESLLGRIADIRTWTYVSHRSAWLANAAYWQERTRGVEDRLSDALHERLTQQFVDRRAAVLARHAPDDLLAVVTERGEVLVQGLLAGRLEGLRFLPDPEVQQQSRGLLAAANRALRGDIGERVGQLCEEANEAFALSIGGQVAWRGAPVARLVAGEEPLLPRIELLPSELLDVPLREKVRRRLADWLGQHLEAALAPLTRLRGASLSGPARGLVFTLAESLGCVRRRSVAAQLAALSPSDRRQLTRLGVRLGRLSIFLPALLNPQAIRLRGLLFAVRHQQAQAPLLDGRPSLTAPPDVADAYLLACGYQRVALRAIRADCLERLAAAADRQARRGRPAAKSELGALVGCSAEDVATLLEAIGYSLEPGGRLRRRRRRSRARRASPQVL